MTTEIIPSVASDLPHNSQLGQISEGPARLVVRVIHAVLPSITANHLTIAGGALTALGSAEMVAYHLLYPSKSLFHLAAGKLAAGAILDRLDGAHSRLFGSTEIGATLDAFFDRLNNFFTSMAGAAIAYSQNRPLTEATAYFAAGTCALPSWLRNSIEAQGHTTQELGKNILAAFGTQALRTACHLVALLDLEIKIKHRQLPIAPFLYSLAGIANLYNAAHRLGQLHQIRTSLIPEQTLSPEKQRQRQIQQRKANLLLATSILTLLAASATPFVIRRISPRR